MSKKAVDINLNSKPLNTIKIGIVGRKKNTANYEAYLSVLPFQVIVTLILGELASCDGILLPGGGDISPAFFGERNTASRNIDTELDILQFQALETCIRHKKPVLGICKGIQVINVAFGGTLHQELPTAYLHRYLDRTDTVFLQSAVHSPALPAADASSQDFSQRHCAHFSTKNCNLPLSENYNFSASGDQLHITEIAPDSFLHDIYGDTLLVNSAHHQGIKQLGQGLKPIQWCTLDHSIEALTHTRLPIIGLQWHPERLKPAGELLLPFLERFFSQRLPAHSSFL